MTVTHRMLLACAFVLGLILLLVDAVPVAGHAELVSTDPAADSEVEAPFDGPIVLTFDEALASGSSGELARVGRGDPFASATVEGDRLVFTLDGPLDEGRYVILWTSVGADRDVDRGEVQFSVVAPSPTPTPAPTTARPTTGPTLSPVPTPSPTPSGSGTPTGSSADVLFPLLAAVIAIGALGAFLLNRNRRSAGR